MNWPKPLSPSAFPNGQTCYSYRSGSLKQPICLIAATDHNPLSARNWKTEGTQATHNYNHPKPREWAPLGWVIICTAADRPLLPHWLSLAALIFPIGADPVHCRVATRFLSSLVPDVGHRK